MFVFLTASAPWAAAAQARALPVADIPVAVPAALVAGLVLDSASGRPLAGASVTLRRAEADSGAGGPPVALDTVTGDDGAFSLSAAPGRYALLVRRIGFTPGVDTLALQGADTVRLTVRLAAPPIRLGWSPPTAGEVARARARRAEWTCAVRDRALVTGARAHVIRLLGEMRGDPAASGWGLPASRAAIARDLRRVTSGDACRRAAEAYDRAVGASGVAFLVHRLGRRLYIVEQPSFGGSTVLLDARFQQLAVFIVP